MSISNGLSSTTWKILHAKKRDRTDFPLANTCLELSVTDHATAHTRNVNSNLNALDRLHCNKTPLGS